MANTTNLKSTLGVLVQELQDLEYIIGDVYVGRLLNYAIGDALDKIGAIVGQPREVGQDDASYRDAIQFKILLNRSSGEPETLIEATVRWSNGSVVRLFEVYPGQVIIFTNGTDAFTFTEFLARMDALAPAGVRLTIVANASDNPFRFKEIDLPDPTYGDGWSEYDYAPEVGGAWSELL